MSRIKMMKTDKKRPKKFLDIEVALAIATKLKL
jgi:hypothetical protein